MVLGMGVICLGTFWVLLGTFLVDKGLKILGVVKILLDKDADRFNWCLLELTVGVTGDFAVIFFLVGCNGGLDGGRLERDPFGFVILVAIDFSIVGLDGLTNAGLEAICFELMGFDMVVGFMLAGFDKLLGFKLEVFDMLVGFDLLGFDALVGFELKAFDMIVFFKLLGFDTLMVFKSVGFGLADTCNDFTVTVLV